MKEYFFISGLPRSGSTLLSAILRQNPDFYSDISSPVFTLVNSAIDNLTSSDNNCNIQERQRIDILKYIFEGYYLQIEKPVVFDTSRAWTAKTSLLKTLFPKTKILCCVRDVESILNSFEKITAKNSLYANYNYPFENENNGSQVNSYFRCINLMDHNKNGIVINSLRWLQDGLALNKDLIFIIEYEQLCKNPTKVMKEVYNFIEKPYFEHDFNNVAYTNKNYDRTVNLIDLHSVRSKVEWVEEKNILPEYVLKQYSNLNFWKTEKKYY